MGAGAGRRVGGVVGNRDVGWGMDREKRRGSGGVVVVGSYKGWGGLGDAYGDLGFWYLRVLGVLF